MSVLEDFIREISLFRSVFKVLSNKSCLLVLSAVSRGLSDVSSIASELNLSKPYVYDVVRDLRRAGFLDFSVESGGKRVLRLSDKCLVFLKRLLEDLKWFSGKDSVESVFLVERGVLRKLVRGFCDFLKWGFVYGLFTEEEFTKEFNWAKRLAESVGVELGEFKFV